MGPTSRADCTPKNNEKKKSDKYRSYLSSFVRYNEFSVFLITFAKVPCISAVKVLKVTQFETLSVRLLYFYENVNPNFLANVPSSVKSFVKILNKSWRLIRVPLFVVSDDPRFVQLNRPAVRTQLQDSFDKRRVFALHFIGKRCGVSREHSKS